MTRVTRKALLLLFVGGALVGCQSEPQEDPCGPPLGDPAPLPRCAFEAASRDCQLASRENTSDELALMWKAESSGIDDLADAYARDFSTNHDSYRDGCAEGLRLGFAEAST